MDLNNSQKDQETGVKVVYIMQTIAEELDERERRMLRKLFGIEHPRTKVTKELDEDGK